MHLDPSQIVYIIDDDEAVRDSLYELLDSVNIKSRGYPSAQRFLQIYTPELEGCLVLDIRMPGMSGLELQHALIELECTLPIIFITGHGDVPMAVEAMKKGATEFIQKPFREQELLDCINAALKTFREEHSRKRDRRQLLTRLDSLTSREREVLESIINGHTNKVIALDLEISQRTVENHRASIIDKMNAKSTANLIKMMVNVKPEIP